MQQALPYASNIATVTLTVAVLLVVVCCFLFKAGGKCRKSFYDPARTGQSCEFTASTTLGLLALILGFTFSLVINRFEFKRVAILNETNAIGTAYLRTQVLDAKSAAEIRPLLRDYADARILFFEKGMELSRDPRFSDEIKSRQKQIWDIAVRIVASDRSAVVSLFLSSLNEMFDLQNTRSVAFGSRLPQVLYFVIIVLSCVGLGAHTFDLGFKNESGLVATVPLVLVLALTFALIQDLDRPQSGFVRIGQDTMIALKKSMDQSP